MTYNKPITRRMMEVRSSMLKQTKKDNRKSYNGPGDDTMTGSGQTQDENANLQNTTVVGTSGGTKKVPYKGKLACEDPNSATCKQYKAQLDKCKETPNAEGCGEFMDRHTGTQKTEGEVNVSSDPVLSKEKRGSSIDLYTSPEGRASFRTGQSQGRFVRKTGNQLANAENKLAKFLKRNNGTVPVAGDKGYKKYQKLAGAVKTFKSQSEGAQKRLENYREMTDGMRNPYVTKRMEYGRDLQKQTRGGQPVKAPEGTPTVDEFKQPFLEFAGKDGDSTPPPGNQGQVSSFSSLLSNDAFQPVRIQGSGLFENLGSLGEMQEKLKESAKGSGVNMLKKRGAFKMRKSGSKK